VKLASNMKAIKNLMELVLVMLFCIACSSDKNVKKLKHSDKTGYIRVSADNPGYFEDSEGFPYIPIGINMISPGGRYRNNPDSSLYDFGQWMKKLSENGGNFIRVWISSPFWDVEDQHAGEYREEKAQRIARMIEMARGYNLRIKITMEHFRSLTMEENPQSWAVKSVYHTSNGGPLDSIRQYLRSAEGKKLFVNKLDFYRDHFGSDTIIFGWELWNEMNAMKGPEDSIFFDWNEMMLKETKQRFPDNIVMQSLGSFDNEKVRPIYKRMMLLQGNQVAQVHRYLDLGAQMEVCKMPMDIICASAIEEIKSYNAVKPIILAETGAVESRHSGPSKLYAKDTAGILLHDILYAPFFTGAAGAGMSWHWDSYVDKNNLWYHFKRFSETVKGINPITERFITSRSETDFLRIYQLNGQETILLWLRDKRDNWETELRDGQPPLLISRFEIDLGKLGIKRGFDKINIYDPWQDIWEDVAVDGLKIILPDFKRSLVIRIEK
jgi:hypothetical protein